MSFQKHNVLRHILIVFSHQKFWQWPYLVAIWISTMCLLRTPSFVQILLKTILLSVLSRESNHHWGCEILDPNSCLTEETSPVACGSLSLGGRFSTFRYIAAKVTASRPDRLESSPFRLFLLTSCQPAPAKLSSHFLYYLMSLHQLQMWQNVEWYGMNTMNVEQTIILKALVTYLK